MTVSGILRRKLTSCVAFVLVIFVASASACRADIIYGNISAPGGTYVLSPSTLPGLIPNPDPYFTFGDHVTFGPGGRTITSIKSRFYLISFFNPNPGQPMTTDVHISIYDDDNGTVGSLLGTTSIFGHTFQQGVFTTLTFPNTSIRVGDTAFVAVITKNVPVLGQYAGYELYGVSPTASGIPSPGYSDPGTLLKTYGFGLTPANVPGDFTGLTNPAQNLNLEISAIPEPNFGPVGFAALAALLLMSRHILNRRGAVAP